MLNKEGSLQVAIGVIKDQHGKILISLRRNAVHQGGLWEFPGGKIEAGESGEQALARELHEELNISVQNLEPLIKIQHQYTNLNVLLEVWTITSFLGNPVACEGQVIKWISLDELQNYCFPKANKAIINAIKLPAEYAILNADKESFLIPELNSILNHGVKLIQARIKSLSANAVMRFFELAIPLCKAKGACLLVNSAVKNFAQTGAEGLHLTAKDLLTLNHKPQGYTWVSASCHYLFELQHAELIGVDFVVLAPVLATKTHPKTPVLGWDELKTLIHQVNIPVFALGGMTRQKLVIAKQSGAQGIAGITAFLT